MLTCQYHFTRYKDEQHYSRLDHTIYETREQLRLIAGREGGRKRERGGDR